MLKHKLKKTTEKMYFGRKSGEKKKSNSKENLYAKVRKSHNQNPSRNERTLLDGGYFTGPESFYESPDHQRNSHENNKSSHGGGKSSHNSDKISHGINSNNVNSDYRSPRENSAHQRIIWEECDHLRESREECDHYKGVRDDCHNHHSRGDCDPHFHHDHRSKQEADLEFSRMEHSLGYSSGEFSSGSFLNTESFEKSSNQTKVRGETVDHRRQQNSNQQNINQQQKSNQQKFNQVNNQKSYQQQQQHQQQQKFRKQLFSNQLPQPAPVVVPMQVLWNRRASPQEDFLYTAQGIQELVKQQNIIVNDLKRSLEATVINAKAKENRRNYKKPSHPTTKQSFQEPSSMGKIRRLLEIEEMLSFSQKINSKITKQKEVN